ncbi:hypothetical protein MOSL_1814 [Moraxella osloensis]|nr:hypothetical protein MOSL_1814 [Moraxella osloensis]
MHCHKFYLQIHRHTGGLENHHLAVKKAVGYSPPHRRLRKNKPNQRYDPTYSPPHRRLRNFGWVTKVYQYDSPPHRRLRKQA